MKICDNIFLVYGIQPYWRYTSNIKTNISLSIHLRFTKYPVIDLASVIYNKPEILPNPIKHFLNKTRSTCYTPFYWVVHLIGSSHLICYQNAPARCFSFPRNFIKFLSNFIDEDEKMIWHNWLSFQPLYLYYFIRVYRL